jgi:hypothetical protein
MKKYKKIIYLLSLSINTIFIGCDNKDDGTGKSTLIVNQGVTGVITLNAPLTSNQIVNEVDEKTFNYTITLNKAQSVPVVVDIVQIGGEANSEDFSFDSSVTIPAYSTTALGKISILNNDTESENDETFKLKIGSITTSNATISSNEVSFTIKNNLSPNLELILNFDKSFSVSGTNYTLCGINYDIDFEVKNASGVDTGNTAAQTGACPEKLVITPTTFPNGDYTVKYNIYETGHLTGTTNTPTSGLDTNFHDPFFIPINVDYKQIGGSEGNKVSLSKPISTSVPGTTGEVIKFRVNNGVISIL